MSAVFVHVSDIHFGQERGGELIVHDDVKLRVIEDAARIIKTFPNARANGVLVTGDIAYAGKSAEYQSAGEWLDNLASAIGCAKTDVEVVPGNHDIDRDEICISAGMLLSKVDEEGEGALDEIIASEADREIFYRRFKAYQPFAEGYNCPLDASGSLARSRSLELAPDRTLRFVGLNSAVICSKRADEEGKLLLGARQRVLPRFELGDELVVLAHHPLNWLKDSDDARKYIRNRARVFISGHEHKPRVSVEEVRPDCHLMMMASGALVPPTANEEYNYSYNIIEFAWDTDSDALAVTVHPRAWCDENKDFAEAPEQLAGKGPTFLLGCQRYTRAASDGAAVADEEAQDKAPAPLGLDIESDSEVSMPEEFPLLLLKYFRDLTPGQRLIVLVKLGAVPDDWDEPLTHAIERSRIDELVRKGRISEIRQAIDEVIAETSTDKGHEE